MNDSKIVSLEDRTAEEWYVLATFLLLQPEA